jgi:hypothetical protein
MFGCGLLLGGQALGQIVIDVGDYTLLANTPGQTISIMVSGGAGVQGLNFNIQVADGYPTGGTISGPNITGLDLIGTASNPTIFFANNSGARLPIRSDPQVWSESLTTGTGTVNTSGLLAVVTVDTTGWFGGNWSFALANTQEGATDFAGLGATITDGTITVVPEPASATVVGMGLVLGGLLLRRRRTPTS